MINGINSNNHINSYANSVKPKKTDADTPSFLLQYDERGVIWEHNDQNKKAETQKAGKQQEQGGKIDAVDTGDAGRNASMKKTEADSAADLQRSFGDSLGTLLQKVFGGARSFVSKVFHFIWYGDDKKEEIKETQEQIEAPVKPVEAVSASAIPERKPEETDAAIREMIARHDTDGVVNILTQNHTIRPAHNSTLLTYYDRHGKIVDMNHTNTGRILHGDRNTRSL